DPTAAEWDLLRRRTEKKRLRRGCGGSNPERGGCVAAVIRSEEEERRPQRMELATADGRIRRRRKGTSDTVQRSEE
ncbi:Os01g0257900, partial [Oryza sativa Japonica Group]